MSFFHFGGCEVSSGQGINNISPVTAHLAEFKRTLHSVHRLFKISFCSVPAPGITCLQLAELWGPGSHLVSWSCWLPSWSPVLDPSSTVWKAIPLQIRWKQSQNTSGWHLCARGRFLRQKWLLNSCLSTSLLTGPDPFQVCSLPQCKAGIAGGAVHIPQGTGGGLLIVIFLLQSCVFHAFCRAFHALSLGSFYQELRTQHRDWAHISY